MKAFRYHSTLITLLLKILVSVGLNISLNNFGLLITGASVLIIDLSALKKYRNEMATSKIIPSKNPRALSNISLGDINSLYLSKYMVLIK